MLNERDPRHPRSGGAETHLYEIMSRLAKRGHAVTHFAAGFAGGAVRETVDGIDVRRFGSLGRYYPSAVLACAQETRRGGVDVVVECLNKLPYFSPLYARVPVLALCHHLFGETAFAQVARPIAATVVAAEKLIPLVYRRQRFLTISASTRGDLLLRGIAPERVEVSLPGIRRPRAATRPLRERRMLVTYVGRLEPYKRVDVLLRAVAPLTAVFPALEVAVIGRGSDRERIERLSHELGIASRLRMPGFVDDDERDRWLADSRVCVCASEKEGWGLTVIEANAVGTPVVASDAPGLRDSVRHGETGWLAPTGDVEAFRAHIADLLVADERAETMGRRSEEWSRRFDWDVAATEMETALERTRSLL